jgi:hypothetical protein
MWRLADAIGRGDKIQVSPRTPRNTPFSIDTSIFVVPCILQRGEGEIISSNQFWRHEQCSSPHPITLSNILGAFPDLRLHEYYFLIHTITTECELWVGTCAIRNVIFAIWLLIKYANHPNFTCNNAQVSLASLIQDT